MRNKKAPIKEDATNEQSKPTFCEPVFLGCNEVAKNDYIYSVQALFNEAQAIAEILRAKGLPVDKGTITDSLTMRKVISMGAEVETCENCEHLDEAFKKMVHDELEGMKSLLPFGHARCKKLEIFSRARKMGAENWSHNSWIILYTFNKIGEKQDGRRLWRTFWAVTQDV